MRRGFRRRTDRRRPRGSRATARESAVTNRLLRLARALAEGGTLEAALVRVADAARELTGSSQASLRLHDEQATRLLVAARSGPSVHRGGAAPFGVGEGLLGWVASHGRPLLSNRGARDRRFRRRPGQAWDPTGILAAPLAGAGACFGVLSAARRDGRPYDVTDKRRLELVAALSAARLEAARLERLAETDALTRLPNRRHLDRRLPFEAARCRRAGRPLAVVLVDVDAFGRFNARHGVDVGDAVLRQVADRLRGACRQEDVVGRWGGEEFVAVLPGADARAARRVAERMRRALVDLPFETRAGAETVTASFGVASGRAGGDGHVLLRRANPPLRRAKLLGRNRVEVADAGPLRTAPADGGAARRPRAS